MHLLKELIYVLNGLFWCILAFYAPKLRNAGKTHHLLKERKCVKNGLFWCILAFYTPKLKNTGKILYFLKRLIYVFLVILWK
ncbi:hypothetical protein E2C01_037798 [Portunus trituberculatus]|uniref:Uncharacterized protein n=1 Tax=Portunus trituberculatus TaxID=210409 RepID=A0A5B7FI56_PORTR|nr:hypothetical protein [Portunus trituberculatus]